MAAENLTWDIFKETLIEQAEQGVDYFNTCRCKAKLHTLTADRLIHSFKR